MTHDEFRQVLAIGAEQTSVEAKGPGTLSELKTKVVKAMMGMANRRDGGTIIVGLAEEEGSFKPVGLSDHELASWQPDKLADQVAKYCDPELHFTMEQHSVHGATFILITVPEFEVLPIICRRSSGADLHEGRIYARSRHKAETKEINTSFHLREILDIAMEKSLSRALRMMTSAGIEPRRAVETEAFEAYERQLRGEKA